MEPRELGRLLAQAVLRAGVVGGIVLAVPLVVVGGGTGLVGILLVVAGGLVAGIALVDPPDRNAGYEAGAAAMVSSIDPLAHSDTGGTPRIRRFLFGVVLLVIGAVAVVAAG